MTDWLSIPSSQDEVFLSLGKDQFLSLSDEERLQTFNRLVESFQDLKQDLKDSEEAVLHLQNELLEYRHLPEENRALYEAALELKKNRDESSAGQATVEVLQRDFEELKSLYELDQQEKSRLNEKIAELEKGLAGVDQEMLKEKEEEMEALKKEKAFFLSEVERVKTILLQAFKEVKVFKDNAVAYLKEKGEFEKAILKAKKEIDALLKEKGQLEEMLKKLKTELETQLLGENGRMEDLQRELSQAKVSLGKRLREVTLLEDERDKLLEKLEKLESSLQAERVKREQDRLMSTGEGEILSDLEPHIEALVSLIKKRGEQRLDSPLQATFFDDEYAPKPIRESFF